MRYGNLPWDKSNVVMGHLQLGYPLMRTCTSHLLSRFSTLPFISLYNAYVHVIHFFRLHS